MGNAKVTLLACLFLAGLFLCTGGSGLHMLQRIPPRERTPPTRQSSRRVTEAHALLAQKSPARRVSTAVQATTDSSQPANCSTFYNPGWRTKLKRSCHPDYLTLTQGPCRARRDIWCLNSHRPDSSCSCSAACELPAQQGEGPLKALSAPSCTVFRPGLTHLPLTGAAELDFPTRICHMLAGAQWSLAGGQHQRLAQHWLLGSFR